MAVPDPRTWEDGEDVANVPTAAIMNSEWAGAMDFLLGNSRPIAIVRGSGGEALTFASYVPLLFGATNEVLRGGMVHSTSSNTDRIILPETGTYRAILSWGTSQQNTAGGGKWNVGVGVNGTLATSSIVVLTATPEATFSATTTHTFKATAGDYANFQVRNSNQSGTCTVGTGGVQRPRVLVWFDNP